MRRRGAVAVAVVAFAVAGACNDGYDQNSPTQVIDRAKTVGTEAEERDQQVDNGVPDDAGTREQQLEEQLPGE